MWFDLMNSLKWKLDGHNDTLFHTALCQYELHSNIGLEMDNLINKYSNSVFFVDSVKKTGQVERLQKNECFRLNAIQISVICYTRR